MPIQPDDDIIIAERLAGTSTMNIGRKLRRGKNSIAGRISRLKRMGLIESLPSPIRPLLDGAAITQNQNKKRHMAEFAATPSAVRRVTMELMRARRAADLARKQMLSSLPSETEDVVVEQPPIPKPLAPTFRPGFNFIRSAVAPRDAPTPRPAEPPVATVVKSMTAKCLYPLWGDGRPTHLYCGAPAELGTAWCPKCRKIVFVRMHHREERAA